MDAATVLSQVDQEQFKQDVISALTSGQQPLDPNHTGPERGVRLKKIPRAMRGVFILYESYLDRSKMN